MMKCTDCAEMVRVRQYHVGSLTKSVKDRDIYVAGSRTTHQVNDEMYWLRRDGQGEAIGDGQGEAIGPAVAWRAGGKQTRIGYATFKLWASPSSLKQHCHLSWKCLAPTCESSLLTSLKWAPYLVSRTKAMPLQEDDSLTVVKRQTLACIHPCFLTKFPLFKNMASSCMIQPNWRVS